MRTFNGILVWFAVIGCWNYLQYGNAQSPKPSAQVSNNMLELLSPPFPDESERKKTAEELAARHGRKEAATILAAFVNSHPVDANQLYAARELGRHLQPEFDSAVLSQIQASTDPSGIGRQLFLLRTSNDLKILPAIAGLLIDKRIGETMPAEWQANGAIALRVCDIAYNVLQEVQAADKSTAQLLNRTQSSDARDHLIAQAHGQPAETQAKSNSDAALPFKQPSTLELPSSPRVSPSEVKSVTTSEKPPASPSWLVWAVLIVAAFALLWLLLKARK